MKKDYYKIEKNVERVINGGSSNFLDGNILNKVSSKLKKGVYNIYYPYKDSEKVILYSNDIPGIRLIEIISNEKLSHRSILGSLFSLNIDSELFGDIVIYKGHYYFFVMDSIFEYIINNFNMIGNSSIKLMEASLSILDDYERSYESIELIVSSLRIDNIVSKIVGTGREGVKKLFLNDFVIFNYEVCHRLSSILKSGDIFSIRRYGKYRFDGVIKESKRGSLIIRISKYLDI